MIADKVLGNIHDEMPTQQIVTIPFAWFEVEKKRIAKVASDGMEFGICAGVVLRDGDILAVDDSKVYVVAVDASHVIQISVCSMVDMGRLCFELGNRHLSLKIEEGMVTIPYDAPTFVYLQKLGFTVHETQSALTDFIVCKAHGSSAHEHSHAHPHEHNHDHDHSHGHHHG